MYRFILGFQRRVWWPKWTPASSRSFIAMVAKSVTYLSSGWWADPLGVTVFAAPSPARKPVRRKPFPAGASGPKEARGAYSRNRSDVPNRRGAKPTCYTTRPQPGQTTTRCPPRAGARGTAPVRSPTGQRERTVNCCLLQQEGPEARPNTTHTSFSFIAKQRGSRGERGAEIAHHRHSHKQNSGVVRHDKAVHASPFGDRRG